MFKVSDATRNGILPHNPWLQFHTSALVRLLKRQLKLVDFVPVGGFRT